VLVDGQPAFSCLVPVSVLEGRRIRTLEGLGTLDRPGPVQRAFIEEQAAQCGYCIPGMILRAQALLERNPAPTAAEIRDHMKPNLCRCGTHMRVLRAVARAAREMSAARPAGEKTA
jgi:aerobic-type carbon monoxide dehydrogenase small subunit (CoxS/CutS family)